MRDRSNRGFTLIELLFVVAVIAILAGIAVPGLIRARMAANEASAIASLRTINSAQSAYSTTCAPNLYAPTMLNLATPPIVGGSAFISPYLNTSPFVKSGYSIAYAGGAAVTGAPPSCNGLAVSEASATYFVSAAPIAAGTSGIRFFATNQAQTIFQHTDPITDISNGGIPTPGAATPVQ